MPLVLLLGAPLFTQENNVKLKDFLKQFVAAFDGQDPEAEVATDGGVLSVGVNNGKVHNNVEFVLQDQDTWDTSSSEALAKSLNDDKVNPDEAGCECRPHPEGSKRGGHVAVLERDGAVAFYDTTAEEWVAYD